MNTNYMEGYLDGSSFFPLNLKNKNKALFSCCIGIGSETASLLF